MKYYRLQGEVQDSIDTHETKWFRKIISQLGRIRHYAHGRIDWDMEICDPFARDCTLAGRWTNDINPETRAYSQMDALEWLKLLPENQFDLVIFDPPFSQVQAERKYGEATNIYTIPSYVPDCMKQIQRILKPGGWFLKFGYNTNSSHSDFELNIVWNVHFAGNKNDVLVSFWQMNQRSLKEWENGTNEM
jgi:hypothetical protein